MRLNIFKISTFVAASVFVAACSDYLAEPRPVELIDDEIVIEDSVTAEQTVRGIYSAIQGANAYGNLLVTTPGVLSDELIHSGSFPTIKQMDENQVIPDNVTSRGTWATAYRGIYIANTVLERIEPIEMTDAKRSQLLGETRFLRAFLHFHLANLWGDVPLVTTTDVQVLRTIDRTAKADVMNFVVAEIDAAADLLAGVDYGEEGFDDADRQRVTEWAAKAMLARVQLYLGNESEAGALADDVIENGPYTLDADYSNVFNGSSTESIWQIFSSANDGNGLAFQFLSAADGGRYEYAPSAQMVAALTDDPDDERADMIEDRGDGTFQVVKYTDPGTGTDQPIVLRLAEMYLIRAEANAGTPAALADINTLRARAGAADRTTAILNDILEERFIELCFEGHRWYDLIRTGQVTTVMSVINPTTWQGTDVLLPIPLYEIQQNPTLANKQNPGY